MSETARNQHTGGINMSPEETLSCLQQLELEFSEHPEDDELRETLFTLYKCIANGIKEQEHQANSIDWLRQVTFWMKKAADTAGDQKNHDYVENLFELAVRLHYSAQEPKCLEVVDQALRLKDEIAQAHPLNKYKIRFLQTRSCTSINLGHLLPEPEFFTKMKELGWIPDFHGFLLLELSQIINKTGIDYWRDRVNVITDKRLIKRFTPLSQELEYNSFWLRMPQNNKVEYFWRGLTVVQKAWEERGHGPLLKISDAHKRRGLQCLADMGVPKDAWFVALHVRDQSMGKNGVSSSNQSTANRDADINSYKLAIQEITSRGGWVIRLGDRSMPKFEVMDKFIDYPFTKFKNDWMDIFIGSQCRFLLGTASGVVCIPMNFGTPVLMTNVSPFNSFGVGSRDIYIPKLMSDTGSGALLPFETCLESPFSHQCNSDAYRALNVKLIPNSSEEIRDVTVEMLDRLDGKYSSSAEDEALQHRFHQIVERKTGYGIASRIGTAFVRKYKNCL